MLGNAGLFPVVSPMLSLLMKVSSQSASLRIRSDIDGHARVVALSIAIHSGLLLLRTPTPPEDQLRWCLGDYAVGTVAANEVSSLQL